MKNKLILLTIIASLGFLSACYNDNLEELTPAYGLSDNSCDTAGVMTYAYHIVPIMETHCGSKNACHGATNRFNNLSVYAGVKKTVLNGKLMSCITWTGTASRMPKNAPKLDDCTIAKIAKWVNAGALEN